MAKKMKLGALAFLIGFGGALVLGLLAGLGVFAGAAWLTIVLVIAGIIIGIMNVSDKESITVMVSALVIGGGALAFSVLPVVGAVLDAILASVAAVVLPIGVVVALVTMYKKAQ